MYSPLSLHTKRDMANHRRSSRAESRVRRGPNKIFYVVFVSVILFVTIFYFYTKKISTNARVNSEEVVVDTRPEDTMINNAVVTSTDTTIYPPPANDQSLRSETEQIYSENPSSDSDETDYEEVADSPTEDIPVHLVEKLNRFYEHLDQQSYMKEFELDEASSVHFSKLLQKLIDTPPVVANETNDLFTLLKNTAHFFRILGKDNILILKGILDREKSSFEKILRTFYALTDHPEVMLEEYSLKLPREGLYDYAGFFLNTMGGRLYLFRRNSASRMTVSFYSIVIIDKANKEEYNRHGIDIRPAIDFLIDEIENTGKHLLLKEDYLDTLYDLKEDYN